MWPTWINMLAWWQWMALLAVPPAIILLYFLKLRRRPLEVPSTYLWSRTIEDLHVNSIWQRLRRNILLWLQLLLLLLVIFALLRPAWQGRQLVGNRFIFLIDNSASMSASDVKPSRLEEAKRQALDLIGNMRSGDVGMVVSFANTAMTEQSFTDNRRTLRRAIESIEPTNRPTSLIEALKVASGLTGSGKTAAAPDKTTSGETPPAEESLSATAYILSDGRFENVTESSLGNLTPVYIPIGQDEPENVAILGLSVRRQENNDQRLQAFARLKNYGPKKVFLETYLRLDGNLRDASRVSIAPGEVQGVVFDVGEIDSGLLEMSLGSPDNLAADDRAWVAVNSPRKAEVLLITPGNQALEMALSTEPAAKLADLTVQPPDYLKNKQYEAEAQSGLYDLVIYDRCVPKSMPQANTLWIGNAPPAEGWSLGESVVAPQIIDTDPNHPMMQWLALDDVLIYEGRPVTAPPGATTLIDSDAGPMLTIAPRETFQDVVAGFLLVDDKGGTVEGRTTWLIRPSFPMFALNTLAYLGNSVGVDTSGDQTVRPGGPITLHLPGAKGPVSVVDPRGKTSQLKEIRPGQYLFSSTDPLGAYTVRLGGKPVQRFAVNLFDPGESDLVPRKGLNIDSVKIAGQAGFEAARREIWRWLILLGLVVLMIEWYIYNHRVSV